MAGVKRESPSKAARTVSDAERIAVLEEEFRHAQSKACISRAAYDAAKIAEHHARVAWRKAAALANMQSVVDVMHDTPTIVFERGKTVILPSNHMVVEVAVTFTVKECEGDARLHDLEFTMGDQGMQFAHGLKLPRRLVWPEKEDIRDIVCDHVLLNYATLYDDEDTYVSSTVYKAGNVRLCVAQFFPAKGSPPFCFEKEALLSASPDELGLGLTVAEMFDVRDI
jgi:hypothetical protein